MQRCFTVVVVTLLATLAGPAGAGEISYDNPLFSFTYPDTWVVEAELKNEGQTNITLRNGKDGGIVVAVVGFTMDAPDDGAEENAKPGTLSLAFAQNLLKAAMGVQDLSRATTTFGEVKTGDGEFPSCVQHMTNPAGTEYYATEAVIYMTSPTSGIGGVVFTQGSLGQVDFSVRYHADVQTAYDILATLKKVPSKEHKSPGWLKGD